MISKKYTKGVSKVPPFTHQMDFLSLRFVCNSTFVTLAKKSFKPKNDSISSISSNGYSSGQC
jgi:hypothetical protein